MRARQTFLTAAALAFAAGLAGSAGAAELVANGGFETGDLTGWTLADPSGFDFVCADGAAVASTICSANSGGYAFTFGAPEAPAQLSQVLATQAGANYTLTFELRNDATDDPLNPVSNGLDVFWNGDDRYAQVDMGTFDYMTVTLSGLTATGADTTLEFDGRNAPSQIFLDSVSVTAAGVPEPANWALMIVGFLGVGGLLRRREASRRGARRWPLAWGMATVIAMALGAEARAAVDLIHVDDHPVSIPAAFGTGFAVLDASSVIAGLGHTATIIGPGGTVFGTTSRGSRAAVVTALSATNSGSFGVAGAGIVYDFFVVKTAADTLPITPVTVDIAGSLWATGNADTGGVFDAKATVSVQQFSETEECTQMDFSCSPVPFSTSLIVLAYGEDFLSTDSVQSLSFVNSISLGAHAFSQDNARVLAQADPLITIDPSTPDAQDYRIYVSTGFSNVAPVSAGVPEPATWALMLLGFGGLGAALRARRVRAAA